jgi:hypothetical protein
MLGLIGSAAVAGAFLSWFPAPAAREQQKKKKE